MIEVRIVGHCRHRGLKITSKFRFHVVLEQGDHRSLFDR
jgi:hypothetical protein